MNRVIGALAVVALTGAVRADDFAAWKAERDARAALTAAKADPARAGEVLKQAIAAVETNSALSATQRDALLKKLRDAAANPSAIPEQPVPKGSRPAPVEVTTDGGLVERFRETAARSATEGRTIRAEKEKGVLGAMRDVDRAGIAPTGDVTFPSDWKERAGARKVGERLTEKQKAVLTSLNTVVPVAFDKVAFATVLEQLGKSAGIPVIFDQAALDQANITSDTLVSMTLPRVTLRTALRALLKQYGLAYIVEGESVLVTTPETARRSMVVKVYDVGDLVSAIGVFDPTPDAVKAGWLVDVITSTIEPDSWKGQGGEGLIRFNLPTRSLIVRQSTEIQWRITGGLQR